jgi:hypothetical protein
MKTWFSFKTLFAFKTLIQSYVNSNLEQYEQVYLSMNNNNNVS